MKKEFIDLLKSESSKRNFLTSMTINDPFKIFWRPNNYRRQATLKKSLNSIDKTTIASTYKLRLEKHSKLLFIKNYSSNITLMVGKFKVTAMWSQNLIGGEKEIYLIKGNNFNAIDNYINTKVAEIQEDLDKALQMFLSKHELAFKSDFIWSRHEDFIKGEEYIDSIPRETIIHDTVFKKVYSEGIEAIGGVNDEPSVKIKHYIKSRMREGFKVDYADISEWADNNIFCIEDVLRFHNFICKFSPKNKLIFTDWIFQNIGGVTE